MGKGVGPWVGGGEVLGVGVGRDVEGAEVGAAFTTKDRDIALNEAVHQTCNVTLYPQVVAFQA